ncbi:MAG TPA: hypothetical protein VLJ42_10625 [Solirubrobacteraceae bacterium]|nr:hypothetical protein [Solirubrobacteraceae bacterium]
MNVSCQGPGGAQCTSATTASGHAAALQIFAADIVLSQGVAPMVTNVGGNLTAAVTEAGVRNISLSASDPGGVYKALFTLDGRVVSSKIFDGNNGRCLDVGGTTDGLQAFRYIRPCPTSIGADIPFDTNAVSDGSHHLVVTVIDVAGNATVALDRNLTVLNHPGASAGTAVTAPLGQPLMRVPDNGFDASERVSLTGRWAHARGVSVVSGFGRVPEIVGKLSGADRRGVGGAAVDVLWTAAYPGARALALPAVRTDPDGSFRVRLPADSSSGTVRLAYRSHLGDVAPVATLALKLRVRTSLGLHVSPRVTDVGRTVFFNGRLLGGPIPAGGKQLVVEARSPGSAWIDFKVIRTDKLGRFHSTYRFRFPGPASYQFRVLSKYEAAFPFISGASNVVGVRER